ncbi:DUF938 domain-containing protein [Marinobacter sp. CA1]|uniref:DUF938 domain-containing protein n=1 Tax=Marinobacter sp. CA1 TaxID=2817656 RepID=UPI001D0973FE|nr:DUF938 domain-containing protein [Marinobacter sp. CA1]UDL05598.1 DUF938 domain-containing protein [Marinobacter sp. CA1]
MSDKPFSQACENNKSPILAQLTQWLPERGRVLEIGTGTGQHAVHFAAALPDLIWQPSDHPDNAGLCRPWLQEAGLDNLAEPVALDVGRRPWAIPRPIAAVYSANTAHIMAWPEVEAMFAGVAELLPQAGVFCLYGPFNYQGRYTSDSNRQFDEHLRARQASMGIRDLDDLVALGHRVGLVLEEDAAMPANNRLLLWRRDGVSGDR